MGKPSEPEDLVYRMGNQKFGVATIVPPSSGSQNWFTLMSYTSREDKSLRLPFSLICKYQRRGGGALQAANAKTQAFDFQCVFKMTELREMTTDERYYPLISNVKVRFYFPFEVMDASLVSSFPNMTQNGFQSSAPLTGAQGSQADQGIFNFDKERRQGEWTFDPAAVMKHDEDKSCERVVLRGTLKALQMVTEAPGTKSSTGSINSGLSSKIVADVTLAIKKYTFSGSRIERVAINQGASSGSSIRNFKDDDSVNRSTRTVSFAKSVQYRF